MEIKKKKKHILQDYGALMALILIVGVLSYKSAEFRDVNNIMSLIRQSTVNGLIAFGMTCVILTGGIDLSVGSVLSLSTVICAGLITKGVPVVGAFAIALALGLVLGLISGFLVTKGKLQPFIATLITMTVYRGCTYIYTDGKPISNLGDNFLFKFLGRGVVFGIPFPVILFIIIFIAFLFMLTKTTFGRKIYATGSNESGSKLAGVKTDRVKLIVYGISGVMSALAGMILLSRLGSAQATLGTGYELDAIAAVAVGGTSMSGGRGRITGTLTGILIIAVLNNGLNILGVSSYYQDVIKGMVILVAVLLDRRK
ncbi:ABC transporter permease [Miniphocaeibacter massiliensis]|uniref:ABC transporter permease n=1 Tax=Miniphocaeibacter massiliensis TaxID=2041841 RepID=UPI000C1C538B|nr:ribose ABC transporter permease [Miniphocaeibacter massiliensis]